MWLTSLAGIELGELQPEREMDALIAELMGWTVFREKHNGCQLFEDKHAVGYPPGTYISVPYEIEPYSTDIAAAWKVVDKWIADNKQATLLHRYKQGGVSMVDIRLIRDQNLKIIRLENENDALRTDLAKAVDKNAEWEKQCYAEEAGRDMLSQELATCNHVLEVAQARIKVLEEVAEAARNAHVMQFTGLRDSKRTEEHPEGQPIYEGDIIAFSIFDYNGSDVQYKGVVKWVNAMFEIWHNNESEYYGSDGEFVLGWVYAQDDEIEVIGTLWDNPELLGGLGKNKNPAGGRG